MVATKLAWNLMQKRLITLIEASVYELINKFKETNADAKIEDSNKW